jgi:hypothetical protein
MKHEENGNQATLQYAIIKIEGLQNQTNLLSKHLVSLAEDTEKRFESGLRISLECDKRHDELDKTIANMQAQIEKTNKILSTLSVESSTEESLKVGMAYLNETGDVVLIRAQYIGDGYKEFPFMSNECYWYGPKGKSSKEAIPNLVLSSGRKIE